MISRGQDSTSKRPGGRPRKRAAEKRASAVKIWLTSAEKDGIEAKAAEARLSMSGFCRALVLGSSELPYEVPPINVVALRQLGGIGNNLNQLTRHLHQGGGLTEIHQELVELLDAFRRTLHAR